MRLCYRGIDYEYTPPAVRMVEGKIGGDYRGCPWKFHVLEDMPAPQPGLQLVYRGVTYATGDLRKVATDLPEIASPASQPKLMLPVSRIKLENMDCISTRTKLTCRIFMKILEGRCCPVVSGRVLSGVLMRS